MSKIPGVILKPTFMHGWATHMFGGFEAPVITIDHW